MSVLENVKLALSSLRSHKMRSVLTMLGIIIGVGSVMAIVAIGQAGEETLKSQIAGTEHTVELLNMPDEGDLQHNATPVTDPFTEEDIRTIEQIPEVTEVVATSSEFSNVRFHEEVLGASVKGINQAHIQVHGMEAAEGRLLQAADFLGAGNHAMISAVVRDDLFADTSPIGEIMYINSSPVKVVGVLTEQEGLMDLGETEVFLSRNTWRNVFSKRNINQVTLKADSADDLQVAGTKAASLLNQTHGTENEYQVVNMDEIMTGIGQVTRVMTIVIGSVAGVSLLVGGIGVMNIMLVSVTERTREIGIRMSLGATRGQILTQFLIESVTLTVIGGLIGISLGQASAILVSQLAGWTVQVSLPVMFGGLIFSMFIGILFGIIPANKASQLDPIASLRYE
ncbi:putative ABC transport system permease protein [Lentibacillus persicus]|uniref:Putative ABC transport system permease protein n=1 Tax=Lentibacillus persicus TaxID=640948 RepID=A0A1I1X6A3_9BACI|nr:ABC transporter permease [Lentibacillus persicus]SFE02892.1 putative ABC transport system permease protein [Lentibacillus persicus]